ncbi:MAG: hypothetical protein NTX89_00235 [Candidatus Omnitrophica bacterium]|nr:hypothetical protein [Candidatus Omnitrophota bacterium]
MRHTLLNKRGISIVEVLLVTAIISLLLGSIFYLLSAAQSLRLVSTAKIEVQSEVRRAMDWIVNDVRQTVNYSIGSKDNNPLSTHIKFKKVIDYDTSGSGSALFGNFIEYTYDPTSQTIIRTDLSIDKSWAFRNIIQAPFYTKLSDGSIVIINPVNPGNDSPIYTTGNLIIDIRGQKQANATTNVGYALKEEVKIRN